MALAMTLSDFGDQLSYYEPSLVSLLS